MIPVQLSAAIEAALHACGRDRVMHRHSGGKPAVAVRALSAYDLGGYAGSKDAQPFFVGEAESYDEAGRQAAAMFAGRLREIAASLSAQAQRIEDKLKDYARPAKAPTEGEGRL